MILNNSQSHLDLGFLEHLSAAHGPFKSKNNKRASQFKISNLWTWLTGRPKSFFIFLVLFMLFIIIIICFCITNLSSIIGLDSLSRLVTKY
jgi:hypothetical protein